MKKLNNKGFSSKEFMIVVVGIIVVIAGIMPIVFSMIEKTRNGAVIDSAEMFVYQTERGIFNQIAEGNAVVDGCYYVTESGNLCLDMENGVCTGEELIIDLDGLRPEGGALSIHNNKVSGIYNLFIDNKYVNQKDNKYYVDLELDRKKICGEE